MAKLSTEKELTKSQFSNCRFHCFIRNVEKDVGSPACINWTAWVFINKLEEVEGLMFADCVFKAVQKLFILQKFNSNRIM